MKLREILGILRDSYARTIGLEYMHIQDPEQRPGSRSASSARTPSRPARSSCASCRSSTRPRPSRPSCRPSSSARSASASRAGETTIPLLDEICEAAAADKLDEVCIGMAHRGRLNVAGEHRRQEPRPRLPRVRGQHRPAHGPGLGRRQVPPRRRGRVHRRPAATRSRSRSRPTRRTSRSSTRCSRASPAPSRTASTAARSSRSCRSSSTVTRRSRARASSPRRSTCRSCAATAPAARST